MYGWMMDDAGAWWLLWLLVPLLLITIVVVLVVTLTRRGPSGGAGPVQSPISPARAILDERYARGEIDREEYAQRREDLGRSAG
ncbi:SHOCT domain-containing protein [Leifsonia sp. AG29]|uniref:SHOCT domain-containing protein n=1 Tax=Leifsonia sp. AG29 TaxID=2598860 RepID=UPI001E4F39CC|nr:SHOCT domain-containing protein [Leifsonia sp. AG29]